MLGAVQRMTSSMLHEWGFSHIRQCIGQPRIYIVVTYTYKRYGAGGRRGAQDRRLSCKMYITMCLLYSLLTRITLPGDKASLTAIYAPIL